MKMLKCTKDNFSGKLKNSFIRYLLSYNFFNAYSGKGSEVHSDQGLIQCPVCVLYHFQLKNGDDHPLTEIILSIFCTYHFGIED